MELTNPDLLGLCLDRGHLAFGGGDPVAALRKHYDRIWHVHFKDYHPEIDEASRRNYEGWIVVEQDVLPGMGSPKTCALHNRKYIESMGL